MLKMENEPKNRLILKIVLCQNVDKYALANVITPTFSSKKCLISEYLFNPIERSIDL